MGGERGQAGIEWMGAVLLVALTLAGVGRLAGRVDAAGVGSDLLHATLCAARDGCAEAHPRAAHPPAAHPGAGHPRSPAAPAPRRSVTLPPLLPVVGDLRGRERPRRAGPVVGGFRRSGGALWRRAWLLCFGYERARYTLLHPESRVRQRVELSGALQMVNDCVSPIDFARDWELIRPR